VAFRLSWAGHREIQQLAESETGGNMPEMIRKLIGEATGRPHIGTEGCPALRRAPLGRPPVVIVECKARKG
jgi:hypothetical protein